MSKYITLSARVAFFIEKTWNIAENSVYGYVSRRHIGFIEYKKNISPTFYFLPLKLRKWLQLSVTIFCVLWPYCWDLANASHARNVLHIILLLFTNNNKQYNGWFHVLYIKSVTWSMQRVCNPQYTNPLFYHYILISYRVFR